MIKLAYTGKCCQRLFLKGYQFRLFTSSKNYLKAEENLMKLQILYDSLNRTIFFHLDQISTLNSFLSSLKQISDEEFLNFLINNIRVGIIRSYFKPWNFIITRLQEIILKSEKTKNSENLFNFWCSLLFLNFYENTIDINKEISKIEPSFTTNISSQVYEKFKNAKFSLSEFFKLIVILCRYLRVNSIIKISKKNSTLPLIITDYTNQIIPNRELIESFLFSLIYNFKCPFINLFKNLYKSNFTILLYQFPFQMEEIFNLLPAKFIQKNIDLYINFLINDSVNSYNLILITNIFNRIFPYVEFETYLEKDQFGNLITTKILSHLSRIFVENKFVKINFLEIYSNLSKIQSSNFKAISDFIVKFNYKPIKVLSSNIKIKVIDIFYHNQILDQNDNIDNLFTQEEIFTLKTSFLYFNSLLLSLCFAEKYSSKILDIYVSNFKKIHNFLIEHCLNDDINSYFLAIQFLSFKNNSIKQIYDATFHNKIKVKIHFLPQSKQAMYQKQCEKFEQSLLNIFGKSLSKDEQIGYLNIDYFLHSKKKGFLYVTNSDFHRFTNTPLGYFYFRIP